MTWFTDTTEHQRYLSARVLQDPLEVSFRTGGLGSIWRNQSLARCSRNLYATTLTPCINKEMFL